MKPQTKLVILSVLLIAIGIAIVLGTKDQIPSVLLESPNRKAALTKPEPEPYQHTIYLPEDRPDFPPRPGQQTFLANCSVCHSLRYVTMQPNFSKKTWAKVVDKMVTTYGAHINAKDAKEITDYLASIKGSEVAQH